MIQDRDHELCEHHLDSLALGAPTVSGVAGAAIRLKSRALFDPYNRVIRAHKPETPTIAAPQRTLAKRQRQSVTQPMADSLSGRTVERRQAFNTLTDQADTCQKEP